MRALTIVGMAVLLVGCDRKPDGICVVPKAESKTGDALTDAVSAKDRCLTYRALTVASATGDVRDLAQGVVEVCSGVIDSSTRQQFKEYSPASSSDEIEGALQEARRSATAEAMYNIAHMRAKKCVAPD